MPPQVLNNVPESQVSQVVQRFIQFDQKTQITCRKNAAGTWTVEAE